jgi:Uma2 family endonuclease
MATRVETTVISSAPILAIPPLEAGDRLTRAEFERRYTAMSRIKKAELIEGVVYMPSPVSEGHSDRQVVIDGMTLAYMLATPGTKAGSNGTVRLSEMNEPQPDGFLRIERQYGGQSRSDEDGFVEGAPDLVVEIASSSVSYDLHDKLNAYRKAGVREYVVWRVRDEEIDWFVLRDKKYERLAADAAGFFRSEVFPGFWLDRSAALRGDAAAMLATLQHGFATPEHAAFVEQLRKAADANRK